METTENNTLITGTETERVIRRQIPVENENTSVFANGRGDVRGARGAESSADIIMAGANNG